MYAARIMRVGSSLAQLFRFIEAISESIEDGPKLASEPEAQTETVSSSDAEAMLEQLPDMAPEQVAELLSQMLRDER